MITGPQSAKGTKPVKLSQDRHFLALLPKGQSSPLE